MPTTVAYIELDDALFIKSINSSRACNEMTQHRLVDDVSMGTGVSMDDTAKL